MFALFFSVIVKLDISHQVSLLASGFGLRSARKVSTRWSLEADFARPNQLPDLAFVLMAKASQLRKVGQDSWK